MKGRLLLDKPIPSTLSTAIHRTRLPPGQVIPEWKKDRGYVLVYSNRNSNNCGAIIFVHGGSFTGLSPSEGAYVYVAQELCRRTGLAVIVPDYPLAPVEVYPSQPNSILKTRMHFANEYDRFVLGSDSAGGAIAFSLLLKNPHLFRGAWFLSPWLNMECDSPSYTTRQYCKETGQGDRIYKTPAKETQKAYRQTALQYLGKESRFGDGIANPFLAGADLLAALPPTLLLAADQGTIRDDSLIMGGRIQDAGGNCVVSLYDGMWHDWMLYSQRSCPKQGEAAYQQVINFIGGNSGACGVPQAALPSVAATIVLTT